MFDFEGIRIFQGHLSFEPIVADILSVALTLQFTVGYKLAKRALHRADTQRWTKLHNVLLLEATDLIHRGASHSFKGGELGFHKCKSVFKITVCSKDSAKQIFDERDGIRFSLMPTLL